MSEARDKLLAALRKAQPIVCSMECPSVKKDDGKPWPHSEICKEIKAAISATADEMSYEDLRASGGIQGAP